MTDAKEVRGIAVVADSPTAAGFRLAGVKRVYEAGDDLREMFERQLSDETVSVIIVNDRVLGRLPQRMRARAEDSINPIVVSIPDKEMNDAGGDAIRAMVKRALGIDLAGE